MATISRKEELCSLSSQIRTLKAAGLPVETIQAAVENLHIDLVLTAHPTEITRRTLIEKQDRIYRCLQRLIVQSIDHPTRKNLQRRLTQLVAQWWHTDDLRHSKPSPLDEAKWGLAVVENSLWNAVPEFLSALEADTVEALGFELPLDYSPICFTSWMGGDRDGNPFVTADITCQALWLSRWKAADLYLKDIHILISELSMSHCTDQIHTLANHQHEPYRVVLKQLRTLLTDTQQHLKALLNGEIPGNHPILNSPEQLWQPLHACYESLHQCGMGIIADGHLKDTLRRINCFGIYLLKLDIRQESSLHADVLGGAYSAPWIKRLSPMA